MNVNASDHVGLAKHGGTEAEVDEALLEISGLSISYGDAKASVKGVDLRMAPGEILGLIGESGSGKSSVAMACAGLLPRSAQITAERLSVCGQDLHGLDPAGWRGVRGRTVGTIFQDAMGALDPSMRIGRQLAEVVARHQGLSGAARRRAVLDLMDRVGIPEPQRRARQYSFQLSGGLRQRVAIALALAGDPKLLLADEPTTALDVTVQAGILELFQTVRDEFGVGILLISHDMGVVAQTADRVAVMLNGQIVERGAVDDVLLQPKVDYTRKLLAAMPRLEPNPAAPSPVPEGRAVERAIYALEDVQKVFRSKGQHIAAVRGVSLEVREGEVLSIVGESGSGKSTLARMLAGLDGPTHGAINFEGAKVDPRGRKTLKGRLQMVFQHPLGSLNPKMRIQQSVGEPLGAARRSAQGRQRVRDALKEVGLPEEAGRRLPHEFSGGQAQRIAIARALVARPGVVILDEPTSALDVSVQAQILEMLAEMKAKHHLTYIFISHDLAVVRQISDRVAVMYAGEIVEVGEAAELFANPRHWYTKALLSAVPSPDPRQRLVPARSSSPGGSAGVQTHLDSCAFASRCSRADETCRTSHPQLLRDVDGHYVSCHHPAQPAAEHEGEFAR
ncbi:MAG TPA: ABC transporter ATP-binding protein [Flexivirga sp.]|uniref:ABC transporter ATP-binding protein n=1 Tax=Flexivirga sp. TaxID=1962927 RepID=UPI002CF8BDA0|nr:ABC transporter ATP-binding protein [Flexivirga sp.]HWC23896.1 ABC transporter ATP-binding protein [Flexivirga sp.]